MKTDTLLPDTGSFDFRPAALRIVSRSGLTSHSAGLGLSGRQLFIPRAARRPMTLGAVLVCFATAVLLLIPWPLTFLASTAYLFAGFLVWTYLEYTGHRFVMHGPGTTPACHRKVVGTCCQLPSGRRRAFVMVLLVASVCLAVFFSRYCYLVAGLLGGWLYCCYMRIFVQWKGMARLFPALHRHHLYHLAGGNDRGFGWTNIWWDRFFGTHVPMGYVYDGKRAE